MEISLLTGISSDMKIKGNGRYFFIFVSIFGASSDQSEERDASREFIFVTLWREDEEARARKRRLCLAPIPPSPSALELLNFRKRSAAAYENRYGCARSEPAQIRPFCNRKKAPTHTRAPPADQLCPRRAISARLSPHRRRATGASFAGQRARVIHVDCSL